ncbi:unnamed protein product, partial [Nesidiocoris tenuis]
AFRPITEVVPGVPCRPQGERRNQSGHVAGPLLGGMIKPIKSNPRLELRL